MLTINWVSTPWGQILHEQGSVIVAWADQPPSPLIYPDNSHTAKQTECNDDSK